MKDVGKLIENARIRPHNAAELKNKAFELSMKKKDFIRESELIHFLLDECVKQIDIDEKGELYLKRE
ncbi:hypothetical protein ACTQ9E_000070 [Vibrio vulnificus]